MSFTRRDFLRVAVFGALTPLDALHLFSKPSIFFTSDSEENISLRFHLFRPYDLLDLEISFVNVQTDDEKNELSRVHQLFPADDATDSWMIVRIPQMHIAE